MIARLRGELWEHGAEEVVVDVGGVGYLLHITASTGASLGPLGSRVELYVQTQVREDAITLFGFATPEEREAFRLLQNVSGIGPKLARSILSTMPPDDLGRAIRSADVRLLSRAPGVGRRTAERIVVELKESFPYPRAGTEAVAPAPGAAVSGIAGAEPGSPKGRMAADLEQALTYMGYRGPQIQKVLAALEPRFTSASLEELIRDGLALLQGRTR